MNPEIEKKRRSRIDSPILYMLSSTGKTKTITFHPQSDSCHLSALKSDCQNISDWESTLKDSPGENGKKERVFSDGPHFPAKRALRWTALSMKLTLSCRPTSPSVSSS